jgi:hypothetical protein
LAFIDAHFLQFLPTDIESADMLFGADQNSYMDNELRTSPMPPGFWEDWGSLLSPSTYRALGGDFYDYMYGSAGDSDPEIGYFDMNQNLPALMAEAGITFGQDFQRVTNGVRINFYFYPGTPAYQEEDGDYVVSSGFYRSEIVSANPYHEGDGSDFVSTLAASSRAAYFNSNNVDFGDPVPLLDSAGRPVLNSNGQQIMRPDGITVEEIFTKGTHYRNMSPGEALTIMQIFIDKAAGMTFSATVDPFTPKIQSL